MFLLFILVVHCYARHEFPSAYTILVCVVTVLFLDAQVAIRVVVPATAAIHRVVDAADEIVTAHGKHEGIVLTVVDIWHGKVAQHWREHAAWGTQAIDAQGVVAAIFRSPLGMVDLARRKDVLVDVSENVRADYRGGLLFHEGIIISLQRVLVEIHVVGVELHDETAATRVVGFIYYSPFSRANVRVVKSHTSVGP